LITKSFSRNPQSYHLPQATMKKYLIKYSTKFPLMRDSNNKTHSTSQSHMKTGLQVLSKCTGRTSYYKSAIIYPKVN